MSVKRRKLHKQIKVSTKFLEKATSNVWRPANNTQISPLFPQISLYFPLYFGRW